MDTTQLLNDNNNVPEAVGSFGRVGNITTTKDIPHIYQAEGRKTQRATMESLQGTAGLRNLNGNFATHCSNLSNRWETAEGKGGVG